MTNNDPELITLRDGTPARLRPIYPSDRDALLDALLELDPESRVRRFFYNKKTFSEDELTHFSSPDGVNHIAFGVEVETEDRNGWEPISVARCFRDAKRQHLAEVTVVTSLFWQGSGAGSALMRKLAEKALKIDITHWFAQTFEENVATRKLLDQVATLTAEQSVGGGIVELIYQINP